MSLAVAPPCPAASPAVLSSPAPPRPPRPPCPPRPICVLPNRRRGAVAPSMADRWEKGKGCAGVICRALGSPLPPPPWSWFTSAEPASQRHRWRSHRRIAAAHPRWREGGGGALEDGGRAGAGALAWVFSLFTLVDDGGWDERRAVGRRARERMVSGSCSVIFPSEGEWIPNGVAKRGK